MCYHTSILRGIAVKTDIYYIHNNNSPGTGSTNAINYLVKTQMFSVIQYSYYFTCNV